MKYLGLRSLVLLLALGLLVGCAPSVGRSSSLPFTLGDTLHLYAIGASISDGNRQTIRVVTRPERAGKGNTFYAIGSADEKTTFLYYYPDDNMIGIYLFLQKGRDALEGDAVICIAEPSQEGWTGGWLQSTLAAFRQMVDSNSLRPQGICTVQKR